MPTSGSPRSWKPQVTGPKSIRAAMKMRAMIVEPRSSRRRPGPNDWTPASAGVTRRLNNDVHQSPGNHDDLLRRLPVHELLHRLILERQRLDALSRGRGRHADVAA